MSRFALMLCAIVAWCMCATVYSLERGQIKHVVVLVMENRAFDHMLGFLKADHPEIDGCLPNAEGCSNPDSSSNPTNWFTVSNEAAYRTVPDPDHSIHGTTKQIWPSGNTSDVPSNFGFIESYAKRGSTQPETVMQSFSPEHVPIISQLATEFAVVDGWFAGVPGPTEPNRCFVVAATSNGMGTNDVETMVRGIPSKTIFSQILDMGLDYRLYMKQVPANIMFKEMRRKDARQRYRFYRSFVNDAKAGNLTSFSFIEPAYFDTPFEGAADQHPDHDVSLGEAFIKDVYETLRASPNWEESALVITWDEHGGFYDHVIPPYIGVPSPDGVVSTDDPFDFTRLGIRVPTVIVSPLIPKGTVIHARPKGESQFEHSSIPATIPHKILKPSAPRKDVGYLNARDAWAATFEEVFSLSTPRTDTPVTLADVPSHRVLFPQSLPPLDGQMKVTDMQQTLIMMVAAVSEDEDARAVVSRGKEAIKEWTEAQAMDFIEPRMATFVTNDSQDKP